jgi:2-hydroxychromene-2-carboxylate isomerase
MNAKEVTLYIDYKSPYAYLAKDPAYELERELDLRLKWLPYTLNIPDFLGTVEERNPHNWRRVRYAYMDARRLANRRKLTVRGPQKIFDSSIAAIAMLFAQRQGVFRKYNDLVFERFWKRELDIEDPQVISAILKESGADASRFPEFLAGEGRAEHERIAKEAEAIGVFGVPTFVLEGELFWGGDRMWLLRERLAGK